MGEERERQRTSLFGEGQDIAGSEADEELHVGESKPRAFGGWRARRAVRLGCRTEKARPIEGNDRPR